ncbi:MAG: hypothetical protein MUE44_28040 [Oscillatoriaceae cyanobacterium Prado104]|jgi:hypothetical protein|nr:hypothetical protein [Oscillatoriaceae cyanobacterium Prado104]
MKLPKLLTIGSLLSTLAISSIISLSQLKQAQAQPNSNRPHTIIDNGAPNLGPQQSDCYEVDSRKGWQYFAVPGQFTRVVSISGSWSVDYRNYRRIGPEGHSGEAARRLSLYNQYKYTQSYPFGVLIVGTPGDWEIWIPRSNWPLPKTVSQIVMMRINDADNALGDNAGLLQVCFGR